MSTKTKKPKQTKTPKQTGATALVAKRMKEQKSSPARKIASGEGQRGVDSRSAAVQAASVDSSMMVPNVDRSIDVKVVCPDASVTSLALGAILNSLKRGWAANLRTGEESYPYQAFVYLTKAIVAAMESTTPLLQNAPEWYWILTQAVGPKTAPFKTGDVSYTWQVTSSSQLTPAPVQFYQGVNVVLGFIAAGGSTTNGFSVLSIPTYDAVVAETAIKSLFNFYTSGGLNSLSAFHTAPTSKDTSAFAACYPEYGDASNSSGSATTIYSERYIQYPIFAKLAEYQNYSEWRGWSQVQRSGGTPSYVIPRMMQVQDSKALKNHVPPIFKFYNFDEFFEVLSLTLGKALELQLAATDDTPAGSCPLTPQQVQILLRQAILPAFNNEMAQDLHFASSGNQFRALFSVGSNGVSIAPPAMKLPQLLAENVRSASRRIVRLRGQISELDIVPVLGRVVGPQLENYIWGSGSFVYTKPDGETPIDILSSSFVDTGVTYYLDLNGTELQRYANVWNEWITKLGPYLTPLTTPNAEKGIAALATSTMTRVYKPNLATVSQNSGNVPIGSKAKQTAVKHLGKRIEANASLQAAPTPGPSSFFSEYVACQITSTNIPLTPLFKYHRVMILPSQINSTGAAAEATPALRQVFQIEPYSLPASSESYTTPFGGSSPTMLEIHQQMADFDIRKPFTLESEMTTELRQLAESGLGGMFTNLAGMFAEDILGIKGGKAIAGAIGNVTGW